MKIAEYIKQDFISLNLLSEKKQDVIKELISLFYNDVDSDNSKNIEQLIDGILCREALGSTAISEGVALPHIRTENVEKSMIAIGISRKGVNFNSLDLKKTHIFILLLSPINESDIQVKLLSKIAKVLKNRENRENILKSKNVDNILEIFSQDKE